MANLKVKDYDNNAEYIKASGVGSDGDPRIIAHSISSSALPSGAATETTLTANGVLAGAVNETAPASDTASSGLNGRLQRIAQRLTSIIALLPTALGGGGGLKVDGSGTALPVSGTVAVTGVATETTLVANGVLLGAVNETAPASDTASSGLNGRLQRIAQRITSLIALIPAALSTGGFFKVANLPETAGGLSIYKSLDLDEGSCEVIKASAGQLYGMWITNNATTVRWIKFYDATSGTIGTGTPVITFGIPGNATDKIAAVSLGAHGIAFATGLCFGASTGFADADTGAPGTNDIVVNVFYK